MYYFRFSTPFASHFTQQNKLHRKSNTHIKSPPSQYLFNRAVFQLEYAVAVFLMRALLVGGEDEDFGITEKIDFIPSCIKNLQM